MFSQRFEYGSFEYVYLNCVNVFKSKYITTIGGFETRAYQLKVALNTCKLENMYMFITQPSIYRVIVYFLLCH